jgi:hypothetical protein
MKYLLPKFNEQPLTKVGHIRQPALARFQITDLRFQIIGRILSAAAALSI